MAMRYMKGGFEFEFVLDSSVNGESIRVDLFYDGNLLGEAHFKDLETYEAFKDDMGLILIPNMNEVVGERT